MRRSGTEPCNNIRWVIFCFAFVAVCFISNGLRNSLDVVQDVKKAVFYFGKQFGRISLVGPAAAKRIYGITLVKKCFYPFGREAKNIVCDLAGGILLSVKPNISVAEINGKMAQMCFAHRFCFNQIQVRHLVSVISIP